MPLLPDDVAALFARQRGVAVARQLYAQGFSDRRITTALRRGQLVRLHRAAYASAEVWSGANDRARHCMRLLAVQIAAPDAVGWGPTAAVVWGLPVFAVPGRPVVARRSGPVSAAGADMVRWHVDESEVVGQHGLRVTSIALTVVDVVGEHGLPWSLMTVDAALARGVHETDLVATGQRRPTNRKRRQIIEVVKLGDPASESALESTSRGCMVQSGLPIPLCNVVLRFGDRWYRVDFLWLELGVVGECDGKTKYLKADVTDVLWREKRRHERIEESGFRVVRWGYAEVADVGAAMVRRIRRALDAQRQLAFTWPDDVRAEVPVREGVQPPQRVIAEVNRLWALNYPITFVDEWGGNVTIADDASRVRTS